MNKKLIVLAILSASAVAHAHGTSSGSNSVTSFATSGAYVSGTGTSKSSASNTQSASAYVGGNSHLVKNSSGNLTSLTGTVKSYGGTSTSGKSAASNISTGDGLGTAHAAGSSFAESSGKSILISPKMALIAKGSNFSHVETDTGAVGTNGRNYSAGSMASSFYANSTGSLIINRLSNAVADTKVISSNTYTHVGNPVKSGNLTSPVVNNAFVEGHSDATAKGAIINGFKKP
jgi:hypothetical protein